MNNFYLKENQSFFSSNFVETIIFTYSVNSVMSGNPRLMCVFCPIRLNSSIAASCFSSYSKKKVTADSHVYISFPL